MQLTVFVLAAESGQKQHRWDAHVEVPKQFTDVLGETLIDRTLRLCRVYVDQGVYLLTQSKFFDSLPAVKLVPERAVTKAHSVLSVLEIWRSGELLLLYSDVYYSDAAFCTIMQTPGTHFFGRGGRSAFTFKNYGELFAVRLAWEDKARFVDALNACVSLYERTGQQSFWALYRMMAGFSVDQNKIEDTLFIDIHDETDDIDFPQEVKFLIDALEKRPEWYVRFWLRRASLWNKRRRDHSRCKRLGVQLNGAE